MPSSVNPTVKAGKFSEPERVLTHRHVDALDTVERRVHRFRLTEVHGDGVKEVSARAAAAAFHSMRREPGEGRPRQVPQHGKKEHNGDDPPAHAKLKNHTILRVRR